MRNSEGEVMPTLAGVLASFSDTAFVKPGRLVVRAVNDEAGIEEWLRQPIRSITTDRPGLAVAANERRRG